MCKAAMVVLAESLAGVEEGEKMVEIVIGGWGNSHSVIRTKKQGQAVAKKRRYRPLNCRGFKRWERLLFVVLELFQQKAE